MKGTHSGEIISICFMYRTTESVLGILGNGQGVYPKHCWANFILDRIGPVQVQLVLVKLH
jgi:hypothetical protein